MFPLSQLLFYIWIYFDHLVNNLQELLNVLLLVDFHVQYGVSLLRRELILLDRLDNFMYSSCSHLFLIIKNVSFLHSVKTPHDGSLNETNRSIDIVVVYSRDQNFFTLFDEVVLYCAYTFDARNVLVEFRINCHMLGSDGKSLCMLVLILDV